MPLTHLRVSNNFPTQLKSDLIPHRGPLGFTRSGVHSPLQLLLSIASCSLILTHSRLKFLEYVKLTPTSRFLYLPFPLLRIFLSKLFTKLVLPQMPYSAPGLPSLRCFLLILQLRNPLPLHSPHPLPTTELYPIALLCFFHILITT